MRGICPITLKEDDIRKSHIFPKFMWKYLKQTGGTVFRSVENPTKELQNGEKVIESIATRKQSVLDKYLK